MINDLGRRDLLLAAVETLEAQGPGGARHYDLGDAIRRRRIHVDPRPGLHIEYLWQSAQAVGRVNAVLRLPTHRDTGVAIVSLNVGALAASSAICALRTLSRFLGL